MSIGNPNNITSLFLHAASQYSEETAIIEGDEQITYKQLEWEVKNYAAYLLRKGIQPGDRILIFVPMSIDLYKIVLAIFHIGAVAVFLDEWVNLQRMELCCKVAKCKALIAPWKYRIVSVFSKELRSIPIKLNISGDGDQSQVSIYPVLPGDTALITFTTGSTGNPKAANRTHHFLQEQYFALQPILPSNSKIDMTLLPIVLLLNLGTGKTSVIAKFNPRKPASFDAELIYRQLKNNHVQSLTFSPFFLVETAKYLFNNKLHLPELLSIISGGGPVFPDDADIIKKAFRDKKCTIVYGSTESEPISHTGINEFLSASNKVNTDKGLYVGKVDIAATVKVIPIMEGVVNSVESLPLGNVGEIIVSGAHVLSSYFNSEDAFRLNKIQIDNIIWHRTGDAGWLNENDELFLMGRCKQIIRWNNIQIYPFLMEHYLKSIPGVLNGTIIEFKNEPYITIQTEQNVMQGEIFSALKSSSYSELKIIFLKQIPMDKRHNTKIDYDGLLHILKKKII